MHDQAGVPFDLLRVVAVIVDAVAVERHGRVAEQQRWCGHNAGCVIALRYVPDRLRRVPARAVFTVDQILSFLDGQLSVATDFMFDGDETQRPTAPLFHHHVLDHRPARHLLSNPQRRVEFQRATGPHAAGQRHRRQEATARRMPVAAQRIHRRGGLGQAEMDHLRGDVTVGHLGTQGRAELLDQRRRQTFRRGFFAADPTAQVVDIDVGHVDAPVVFRAGTGP